MFLIVFYAKKICEGESNKINNIYYKIDVLLPNFKKLIESMKSN